VPVRIELLADVITNTWPDGIVNPEEAEPSGLIVKPLLGEMLQLGA
jgi:hypothetical protein